MNKKRNFQIECLKLLIDNLSIKSNDDKNYIQLILEERQLNPFTNSYKSLEFFNKYHEAILSILNNYNRNKDISNIDELVKTVINIEALYIIECNFKKELCECTINLNTIEQIKKYIENVENDLTIEINSVL
jgi:hypothetical protein